MRNGAPSHCAALTALALALLVQSCGGDGPTDGGGPGPATTFSIISGNDQQATVGTELPNPIVVRATDASGRVVPNAVVNFVVTGGGGAVFAPAVSTNADGVASNRWTLGTAAGQQTVEVRAIDQQGQPVTYATFAARALPESPERITPSGGVGQSATVGTQLPAPLAVKATDRHGNVVPDVTVAWTMIGGGGSVSAAQTRTDESGVASVQVTLGVLAGNNAVRASVAGLDPVTFTATGTAGSPTSLTMVSGENQQGLVDTQLGNALVVRVVDAHGNNVPGVTVTWSPGVNSRPLSPAPGVTDASGISAALWRLGAQAGAATAIASVAGVSPVTFHATVIARTPGPVEGVRVGPDFPGSAPVGSTITFQVQFFDRSNTPVPGFSVVWTMLPAPGAAAGSCGSMSSQTSDANGWSRTTWTLCGVPGTQSGYFLAANGVKPQLVINATSTPGALTVRKELGPNPGQCRLTATVTGSGGSVAPNVQVTFGVSAGTGTVSPSSGLTDVSGQVHSIVTRGSSQPVSVTVSAAGYTSVTVEC